MTDPMSTIMQQIEDLPIHERKEIGARLQESIKTETKNSLLHYGIQILQEGLQENAHKEPIAFEKTVKRLELLVETLKKDVVNSGLPF